MTDTATVTVPSALMFVGFLSALETDGETLTWSPADAPILAVGDDMRHLYIIGDAVVTMGVVDQGDQTELMGAKWQGFTGRAYDGIIGTASMTDPSILELEVVNRVQAVTYVAPRDMGDGEWSMFRHKFAKADAPTLCLGNDGDLYLIDSGTGGYRFTTRGIVDDSDTAHADVV